MRKIIFLFILCAFLFTSCLSWSQRAAIAKKGIEKYKEYKSQKSEESEEKEE